MFSDWRNEVSSSFAGRDREKFDREKSDRAQAERGEFL